MSQHVRSLILAGAVVGVGGVAFLLGRWSAPEADAVTSVSAPAVASAKVDAPHVEFAGCGHDHQSGSELPPLESEVVEAEDQGAAVDGALELVRQSAASPGDAHTQEAVAAAAGELEQRALADPRALKAVLDRFGQVTSTAELDFLAAVLGRARDYEIEQAALQAARSDPLRERRIAALSVLDAMDTPAATSLALDLLATDADTEVRRAAVFAIPEPMGTSAADAQRVVGALARATADADPELRRRAAIQLGTWHSSAADLGNVLTLLRSDPSVDVRAGAAFALEVAARRDARVLEALTRAMNDAGEDLLVRENAWRALGRLSPLPDQAARDYARFAEELERAEGS